MFVCVRRKKHSSLQLANASRKLVDESELAALSYSVQNKTKKRANGSKRKGGGRKGFELICLHKDWCVCVCERELLYILIAHGNTASLCPVQTTVSWDGDNLVCVQRGEKEGRGWTHWLEGDKLHLVRMDGWK